MAGGGGGAGPDLTSSARNTGRITHKGDIDTNIFSVTYQVVGVCIFAAQWECLGIVCRRLRVRIPFASFLNPDQDWYELVCTCMYWYGPV